MAGNSDNSLPLRSVQEVPMLRSSLQRLTLPIKPIKLSFKAFRTYGVNIK
jgi:hypothetical protein